MRALYERKFKAAKERGETQESIAERGGLRQNAISRMFDIETLGPQVENFVRAIEGLGLAPSQFFAEIEVQQNKGLKRTDTLSKNVQSLSGGSDVSRKVSDPGGDGGDDFSTPEFVAAAAEIIGRHLDHGFERLATRLEQIAGASARSTHRRPDHPTSPRKTG